MNSANVPSDKFECATCKGASEGSKWNEKTEETFGEGITEIGNEGWENCEFVCPSCGEIQGPPERVQS